MTGVVGLIKAARVDRELEMNQLEQRAWVRLGGLITPYGTSRLPPTEQNGELNEPAYRPCLTRDSSPDVLVFLARLDIRDFHHEPDNSRTTPSCHPKHTNFGTVHGTKTSCVRTNGSP